MFIPFVIIFSVVCSAKHVFKIVFSVMRADTDRQLRGAAASSGVCPGRGRSPPVRQSAAMGAAAAAHRTRRRPEEESEPRREGAREAGGKEQAREGTQLGSHSVPALLPVRPTAASGRRVAAWAAAVATDAAGNECTAAPRLSGGQTSFCLRHPDRRRTRK